MARTFLSNPDNAPENQEAYKANLAGMSDKELAKECADKIWFSAYANNNPISCFHWQCDYTYNECDRRGKVAIYSREHARLMREES
jgi:hypothetical protein